MPSTESETLGKICKFFPFEEPPQDIVDLTYIVKNQDLVRKFGFHQTTSSTLLFGDKEEHVLLPAVAVGENTFNLRFLAREVLQNTHLGGRRWAVWFGKDLTKPRSDSGDYSKGAEKQFIEGSETIKHIYKNAREGKDYDRDQLTNVVGYFVSGFWQRYYIRLAERLFAGEDAAMEISNDIFPNFSEKIARMGQRYSQLDKYDRRLVDNSFPIIYVAKLNMPVCHMEGQINEVVKEEGKVKRDVRSPFEITPDPRGIKAQDIMEVFIPDKIHGMPEEEIAKEKFGQMGISTDIISDLSTLKTKWGVKILGGCLLRYKKFGAPDLYDLVQKKI